LADQRQAVSLTLLGYSWCIDSDCGQRLIEVCVRRTTTAPE